MPVVNGNDHAGDSGLLNDPSARALVAGDLEAVFLPSHGMLGISFRHRGAELLRRGIPFEREVRLPIYYKEDLLPVCYRADFICFGEVLVEIKALTATGPIEQAQVINYLRAANLQRALLINFGSTSLQHKRLVWNLSADPVQL